MAKHTTHEQASEWIANQTKDLSTYQYGNNDVTIQQSKSELASRNAAILTYESNVKSALEQTTEDDKKSSLEASYKTVKTVSEKKVADFQMLSGVTSLEENCARMSRELDTSALELTRQVQPSSDQQQQQPNSDVKNIPGFISSTSQDSIFGLRDNWNWIKTLTRCIDVHLKNASEYHKYFHEVKETEPWLLEDLGKVAKCLDSQNITGSEDEAKNLVEELKTVTVTLRQWEARINRIWDTAVALRPLPLRVDGVTQPTPATSLCDYRTSEIAVREGEDILLLENSNPRNWKVRNGRGQEAEIPSVAVLIGGTDSKAIEAAIRLRLELLAAWTEAIRQIGARIISYLMLTFKPDYNMNEITGLRSVRDFDKRNLLDLLSFIEDTLKKQWSDHEGFIALQERILALRMILEEAPEDPQSHDETLFNKLLLQVNLLAQIIELYQALFGDWEKYKVAVEASQQPEMMLIVDKWSQLQFVSREYFAKFWKTKLPVDASGSLSAALNQITIDGVECEDNIQRKDAVGVSKPKLFSKMSIETSSDQVVFEVPDLDDTDSNANQLFTATFKTVAGGRGGAGDEYDEFGNRKEVVLIVKVDESTTGQGGTGGSGGDGSSGSGADGKSGRREVRSAEIRTMKTTVLGGGAGGGDDQGGCFEEGFDELSEISETRATRASGSEQEGTDFGVATERKTAETEQLTAAEMEEKKTFTIKSVVNPADGVEISLQQAILLGVLSPETGCYVNTVTGESKPIATAMNEGLIKVMFTTTKRSQEKTSSVGIITVKTIRESVRPYVVQTAKDTQTGADLALADAAKAGIIDERHGTFLDKKTGKKSLITEAAEKDLVKIEYTGPAPEPEVISKTYAVRAVVDRRLKKTVTFHEAVRRGLIDRDSGAYKDTLTGDTMYVGDAIMRGFLKARVIEDHKGLDIDPSNRMVIDKTEKIRKKLLKPLQAISAFKLAAAAGASSTSGSK